MNPAIVIGEDIERADRATGGHLKESRNFLTGVKLTKARGTTGGRTPDPNSRTETPHTPG